MSKRKEQISFVLSMIHNLCIKYDIALIPCETKKGTKYVGILDNTDGSKYAMIKGE